MKGGGWNYRMIFTKDGKDNFFAIHEVFYMKGKPTSWSVDPIHAAGDSPVAVINDLCLMQRAFSLPPLMVKGNKLIEVKVNNVTGRIKK